MLPTLLLSGQDHKLNFVTFAMPLQTMLHWLQLWKIRIFKIFVEVWGKVCDTLSEFSHDISEFSFSH